MGALCIFLLIACYYDYRYRRIPNVMLLIILITGLARNFISHGGGGFLSFLLIMIAVVFLLYPFFQIGALGAGDVKLFGVCSGYLIFAKVLYFLFFSLLVAAIFSLMKIIITKGKLIECRKWKIPLAGPVFVSVLLYMGGVY